MEKSYKKKIELASLVAVIFAIVAGGPYGLEESISSIGPGLALVLLFIVPLVWSLPISFITAEITSAFPQKGGYITWIKSSFGPFWSFQTGWLSWIRNIVETALYPVLFVDYLRYFIPDMTSGQRLLICVGIVAVFTVLNLMGIRVVGFSSLVLTFIVLIPFLILIVAAFMKARTFFPFETFALPGKPWFNCMGIGLMIMIWNYNGWEDFSTCIMEVKNPAKTYPRAIFINIPLITLLYAGTIYACLCATTNWQSWVSGQFPLIGKQVAGPWLGILLVVAILFGLVNQLSTILLYTSRIPYTLAFHKFLPIFFAYRIKRNRVPHVSLLICSALVCCFCVFPFAGLIAIDMFLYGFMLIFVILTFLKLRKTRPDKERLIKVPFGKTGAIIASLLPFTLLGLALYNSSLKHFDIFFCILLTGLLVWFLISRRILKSAKNKLPLIEPPECMGDMGSDDFK